jgi:amidase
MRGEMNVHRISHEHVVYSMNKDHAPVLEVSAGEMITFQTYDCFSGQICQETDQFEKIGWDRINPATGPLKIREAEPGDILVVKILDIRVADQGVMVAVPDMGVLGRHFTESTTRVIPIEDGLAVFDDKLKVPIDPMIGVIGTAPAVGDIPCGTPGDHGGNMDCKKIRKGTTVYLPVSVPGGLLAMGDLHALMGDGEILICGVEVNGEVDVYIDLLKNKPYPLPMLEDADFWITVATAETLDAAAIQATENMAKWLLDEKGLSMAEAGMLMSALGDLRICQVVDPLLTARFEFPKKYLKD